MQILVMLADLEHATALDPHYYTDPAWAVFERDHIFRKSWQYVAHIGELASKGDHVVAEIAGQPLMVSTIIKLVPLLAVIALAIWVLMRQGTAPILPFKSADININSIALATTLTLWAMLGIEAATVPGDCVRDPERTIPRATLLGTGSAGLIYIFVCSAVVLMLPTAVVAASEAPFADFVDTYWGTNAGTAIAK